MIALVVDMNLSPDWVGVFTKAGCTAVHWSDVGSGHAPDREIMEWAESHDHVVFTHDLDFGTLLAASGERAPSVIQMRCEDTRPASMAALVVEAIKSSLHDLRQGALITIDPKRMRTRILPLNPGRTQAS